MGKHNSLAFQPAEFVAEVDSDRFSVLGATDSSVGGRTISPNVDTTKSMTGAAKAALRVSLLCGISAVLAACGGMGTRAADSAVDAERDGGMCGTHDNPGVLKVIDVVPAPGTTVVNRGIAHGFAVVNAPAFFTNFTLLFGSTHTAGVSTPSDPKIQATWSGNNLIYQFTVDSWSHAPGHVELRANGGYETSKGCSWEFPSPLFSYNVTAALDGGASGETSGAMDGGAGPVDGPYDVPATIDVPLTFDGPAAVDVPVEPDGGVAVVVDATFDGGPSVDAGID